MEVHCFQEPFFFFEHTEILSQYYMNKNLLLHWKHHQHLFKKEEGMLREKPFNPYKRTSFFPFFYENGVNGRISNLVKKRTFSFKYTYFLYYIQLMTRPIIDKRLANEIWRATGMPIWEYNSIFCQKKKSFFFLTWTKKSSLYKNRPPPLKKLLKKSWKKGLVIIFIIIELSLEREREKRRMYIF